MATVRRPMTDVRVAAILRASTDTEIWAQEDEGGEPRPRQDLLKTIRQKASFFAETKFRHELRENLTPEVWTRLKGSLVPCAFPDQLTNAHYVAHFDWAKPYWCECDGDCWHATTYYTVGRPSGVLRDGTPNPDARISLGMLAIAGQSNDDSRHFGRWLWSKSDLFEGFFHEFRGPALHGYGFFDIRGLANSVIRERYDRMDAVLRSALYQYQKEGGARPIDSVSFLGKPAKRKFDGGRVVGIDGGTWLPLPRNAEDYGSDLLESEWREGYSFESSIVLELRHIEELEAIFPPIPGKSTRERPDSRTKRRAPEHPIAIKATPADYMRLAAKIMPDPLVNEKTRDKAIAEDLAIWLMLFIAFHRRPNADGSMPFARFEANWRALHAQGKISRAWKKERYKLLWNYLLARDVLVVLDGSHHPGKAKRWTLREAAICLLDRVDAMND